MEFVNRSSRELENQHNTCRNSLLRLVIVRRVVFFPDGIVLPINTYHVECNKHKINKTHSIFCYFYSFIIMFLSYFFMHFLV